MELFNTKVSPVVVLILPTPDRPPVIIIALLVPVSVIPLVRVTPEPVAVREMESEALNPLILFTVPTARAAPV